MAWDSLSLDPTRRHPGNVVERVPEPVPEPVPELLTRAAYKGCCRAGQLHVSCRFEMLDNSSFLGIFVVTHSHCSKRWKWRWNWHWRWK